MAKDLEERLDDALKAGDAGNSAAAKPLRGFAAMTRAERSAIASKGGKKAQASGRGHRWTSETGRAAAMKQAVAKRISGEIDPGSVAEE